MNASMCKPCLFLLGDYYKVLLILVIRENSSDGGKVNLVPMDEGFSVLF